MTRLVAVQRWPEVPNADQTIPSTREVEIGVVHDDDRVLAAELEVDVLEVLRGRLRAP